MTGDQFLTTLKTAIAPATVERMKNNADPRVGGLDFTLSDGRSFNMKRQRVKDAPDQAALDAYVAGLLA